MRVLHSKLRYPLVSHGYVEDKAQPRRFSKRDTSESGSLGGHERCGSTQNNGEAAASP